MKRAASVNMNSINHSLDTTAFENISEKMLLEMATNLFLFFLYDEYTQKIRKMLTIEQYHNNELAEQYTKQYFDDVLSYQSILFQELGKAKVLYKVMQILWNYIYMHHCIYFSLCVTVI